MGNLSLEDQGLSGEIKWGKISSFSESSVKLNTYDKRHKTL
jgi:hypothetical protein